MKIDALMVGVNSPMNLESNKSEKENNFMSLLDTKLERENIDKNIDENEFKTKSTTEVEEEEELLALMIGIFKDVVNNNSTFEKEILDKHNLLSEEINLITVSEDIGESNLENNNNTLTKLLDKINIKPEEFEIIKQKLQNINSKENSEHLNIKSEIKKKMLEIIRSFEEGEIPNEKLISFKNINNKVETVEPSILNNNENIKDLNKDILFEENSLRKANLHSNENANNLDDDIKLLNSIVFSKNEFAENTKEMAPIVIRKEYITEDIFKGIKYLKTNNGEELNVKMSPRELGDIDIKILKGEGDNNIIITLSKEETIGLIKENINEIKNHLGNLNIQIKEISVELRNGNQSSFSENLNQQFNKGDSREEKRGRNSTVEKEADEKVGYEDTNINLLI